MPSPVSPVSSTLPVEPLRISGQPSSGGFSSVFASAIQSVEGARNNAESSVTRFLSGEGEELHTTILATTQAQLSFDLFLQARNKIVSAYQEVMRMQI